MHEIDLAEQEADEMVLSDEDEEEWDGEPETAGTDAETEAEETEPEAEETAEDAEVSEPETAAEVMGAEEPAKEEEGLSLIHI